jgi:hypothetical protein
MPASGHEQKSLACFLCYWQSSPVDFFWWLSFLLRGGGLVFSDAAQEEEKVGAPRLRFAFAQIWRYKGGREGNRRSCW